MLKFLLAGAARSRRPSWRRRGRRDDAAGGAVGWIASSSASSSSSSSPGWLVAALLRAAQAGGREHAGRHPAEPAHPGGGRSRTRTGRSKTISPASRHAARLAARLTLRIAFWVIGQMAAKRFRPGFLGEIGTIHFARWVLLPKTNKLLFFSNYGGSWESYLEDFITKASTGLTGVWSNTRGLPTHREPVPRRAPPTATASSAGRGASSSRRASGTRAYPHLTTARIRTNAAIRQGLATASTEDEAAAWLGLFGSRVPPPTPARDVRDPDDAVRRPEQSPVRRLPGARAAGRSGRGAAMARRRSSRRSASATSRRPTRC